MQIRTSSAEGKGTLKEGAGTVQLGSGALAGPQITLAAKLLEQVGLLLALLGERFEPLRTPFTRAASWKR